MYQNDHHEFAIASTKFILFAIVLFVAWSGARKLLFYGQLGGRKILIRLRIMVD